MRSRCGVSNGGRARTLPVFFGTELLRVSIPQKKGDPKTFDTDEQPRPDTTLEGLAKLKPIVRPTGTVTAGNASGVNDGSCALVLASEGAAKKHGLTPRARVVATAAVGVAPRIMGFAPAPAVRKVLRLAGLELSQIDVIELNEAFAAQATRRNARPWDSPTMLLT